MAATRRGFLASLLGLVTIPALVGKKKIAESMDVVRMCPPSAISSATVVRWVPDEFNYKLEAVMEIDPENAPLYRYMKEHPERWSPTHSAWLDDALDTVKLEASASPGGEGLTRQMRRLRARKGSSWRT